MTGMVERVARIIWQAAVDPDVGGATWRTYIPAARAAIAEMRETTEGMVAAGQQVRVAADFDLSGAYRLVGTVADDVWQAMIDAALAEQNP